MLIELKVSNFAIISSVHIQFGPGLNILSGETGAGKSILLKSLGLLMGQKAPTDIVQEGARAAMVEGLFDLSQRKDLIHHLEEKGFVLDDDTVIVKRVVPSKGKSRVYINGSLSTVSDLRDVVAPLIEVAGHSAPLIEMTSQHENKNLQSPSYQLDLVDDYSGTWKLRREVETLHERKRKFEDEISELIDRDLNREQKLDFLNYQRDEIKRLSLEPGDEEELENQVKRLKNTQYLGEFSEQVETQLYSSESSAISHLQRILARADELSKWDNALPTKLSGLREAITLIEDVMYEFRNYSDSLDTEPGLLEHKEEQLSLLRKLQRKYGTTVKEILDKLAEIEQEIDESTHFDEHLAHLQKQMQDTDAELNKLSKKLHKKRKSASEVLEATVNDELLDLNMKGVKFHINLQKLGDTGPTGLTKLEFLIGTGKSDSLKPLGRVASGGELSRILLSLKRVIGQSGIPRTYLFDEVDSGVSGPTAEKVGRKLRSISDGQQVLCITHLPQVAAFAHVHFNIIKYTEGDTPITEVVPLNKKDRIDEIARLISGEEITPTSRKHAKTLIDQANESL